MTPRVVASIEARMGSSRLPGKMMADVNGRPAVSHVVERLRAVPSLDDVILATSSAATDDPLADWAAANGVSCFRGSEDDVLARVDECHVQAGSDVIVEITGDCILTDPHVVERGISAHAQGTADVVTTTRTPSYPIGIDVQVFDAQLLHEVAETIDDPAVREHVSLEFYENIDRYTIHDLMAPPHAHRPEQRLVLDYPEDLVFLREITRQLEPLHGRTFGVETILNLLDDQPELMTINGHCREKEARS